MKKLIFLFSLLIFLFSNNSYSALYTLGASEYPYGWAESYSDAAAATLTAGTTIRITGKSGTSCQARYRCAVAGSPWDYDMEMTGTLINWSSGLVACDILIGGYKIRMIAGASTPVNVYSNNVFVGTMTHGTADGLSVTTCSYGFRIARNGVPQLSIPATPVTTPYLEFGASTMWGDTTLRSASLSNIIVTDYTADTPTITPSRTETPTATVTSSITPTPTISPTVTPTPISGVLKPCKIGYSNGF